MDQVLRIMTRARLEIAHRPALRHAIVAGLALLAGWTALSWSARVEAQRASWGDTLPVLVARADLVPGEPLGGSVERRDVPAAVVPPAAIDLVDSVRPGGAGDPLGPGAVARRAIPAGAILTSVDVAMHGHPESLLTPGEVAVAVAERIRSGARVGDQVMVVSDGFVLVRAATVVAVHDDRVVVAVPEELAAGVAAAAIGPSGVSVLVRP